MTHAHERVICRTCGTVLHEYACSVASGKTEISREGRCPSCPSETAHDAIVEQCAKLAHQQVVEHRAEAWKNAKEAGLSLAALAHCCTSHCMCILADRIRSLKESGGGAYVEHLKQGDAALKVQADRLAQQLSVALELLIGSDAAALEYEDRARWTRQFDALMAALGLPDRRG